MRFFYFFIFFLQLFQLLALESDLGLQNSLIYKSQDYFYSNWDQSPQNWTSLENWKWEQTLLEKMPLYKNFLRKKANLEIVGRVLHCIGVCQVYRGGNNFKISHRNIIREGDHMVAEEGSYLLVYLEDGSLFYLAPNSSATIREIAISNDAFFYYLRLSSGHFRMFPFLKGQRLKKYSKNAETDAIFLPFPIHDLNSPQAGDISWIINKHNELVDKNLLKHKHKFKKTRFLFVLSEGLIETENENISILIREKGGAYIKAKKLEELSYDNEKKQEEGILRYIPLSFKAERDPEFEKKWVNLKRGSWYEVDQGGESISLFSRGEGVFSLAELLIKRPYTIFLSRQKWFDHYSAIYYKDKLDARKLASDSGHFLWGNLKVSDKENGLLLKRLNYLRKFLSKMEAVNRIKRVRQREKGFAFKKAREENGSKKKQEKIFNPSYYVLALRKYTRFAADPKKFYNDQIHSQKNVYWAWKREMSLIK